MGDERGGKGEQCLDKEQNLKWWREEKESIGKASGGKRTADIIILEWRERSRSWWWWTRACSASMKDDVCVCFSIPLVQPIPSSHQSHPGNCAPQSATAWWPLVSCPTIQCLIASPGSRMAMRSHQACSPAAVVLFAMAFAVYLKSATWLQQTPVSIPA